MKQNNSKSVIRVKCKRYCLGGKMWWDTQQVVGKKGLKGKEIL